jgi:hypothetical protein
MELVILTAKRTREMHPVGKMPIYGTLQSVAKNEKQFLMYCRVRKQDGAPRSVFSIVWMSRVHHMRSFNTVYKDTKLDVVSVRMYNLRNVETNLN